MHNQLLYSTTSESLQAIRSIAKNSRTFELLINEQVKEFKKIKIKNPDLKRNTAIELSFLNAAVKLKFNSKSEQYCLASVKSIKATPQANWLKLHKSFVLKLRKNGASLREIEKAILYRFHHKISHTVISSFLKMEVV